MPKETIRSSRSISLEVTCTSTLTSTEHLVAAYGHHKVLLLLRNRTANFLLAFPRTNSWTSSEMNESTMRSWRRLQPSLSVGAVLGTVEAHMERCSLSNRLKFRNQRKRVNMLEKVLSSSVVNVNGSRIWMFNWALAWSPSTVYPCS